MFLIQAALAAPVYWTRPPSQEQRTMVTSLPGYTTTLTEAQLRAQGLEDVDLDDVYRMLASELERVRVFETRLDGELEIMSGLQTALDRLPAIRDETDRELVFRTLAYQGFAIQRYFAETLGDDPEGAPWRVQVDGVAFPTPWAHAIALHPDREVTAYDIAEAPERIAFSRARERINDQSKGTIRIDGLPTEATVRVNGAEIDATQPVDLLPGKHFVQADLGPTTIWRFVYDVSPGDQLTGSIPMSTEALRTFTSTLGPRSTVPQPIRRWTKTPVWFATPDGRGVKMFEVSGEAIEAVQVRTTTTTPDERRWSMPVSIGGGWLYSADFYNQAFDVAPNTAATVNSAWLTASVGVDLHLGRLRLGAGLSTAFTPGAFHLAQSGDTAFRLRPYPHLRVGVSVIGLTVGWRFPYHPEIGSTLRIPLGKDWEVGLDTGWGLPSRLPRPETPYQTSALFHLAPQFGRRF